MKVNDNLIIIIKIIIRDMPVIFAHYNKNLYINNIWGIVIFFWQNYSIILWLNCYLFYILLVQYLKIDWIVIVKLLLPKVE